MIAYQNGAPVYMRDVARVSQAAQDVERGAWYNRTPAIVLNVQRQPGANVIATVNQIMKQLPQLESTLPAGMKSHGGVGQHWRDPLVGLRRRVRTGAGGHAGGAR